VAGKADFTEQEWETLQKGVTGAGLLVAISDRGFFDTFKEASTMARHLAEARKDSSSQVVRELGETHSPGFGLRTSEQELEEETLDTIRTAIALLQAKAPDEVDAYKRFVLDVAESVAEAAKGIAPGESQALEKIKAALGSAQATPSAG
jgi:hypothetical protein